MKEKVKALLQKYGLERLEPQTVGSLSPCSRLILSPTDDSLPPGASKFGGSPDLPPGAEIPSRDGKELQLIAQINLADALFPAETALPDKGVLYFFYDAEEQPWGFDPADKSGHKVMYYGGEISRLSRRALAAPISSCKIAFKADWTLSESALDGLRSAFDEDDEGADPFFDDFYGLHSDENGSDLFHHLLGNPQPVQNPDMEEECHYASQGVYVGKGCPSDESALSLSGNPEDWTLLFQADSDDAAEIMWGDSGRIYFWIKKEDLAGLRFDNTWLVLQCC